jgi:protein TonB
VINVPVVAMSAGVNDVPGLITTMAPATTIAGDGPGAGQQAGTGHGSGNGGGNGAGLDTGANGGPGGWRSGNGATSPRLIREVKPGYTSEAMRAHIQGMVRLQAIVLPDGSVGEARVVRSLDDRFGLDQEAVKTVKQWRFQPGLRDGRAVPVVIEVELIFTLR